MLKKTLAAAVVVSATTTAASIAHAQQYPSTPVRVIAPFAPGGGTDFIGRRVKAFSGNTLHASSTPCSRASSGITVKRLLVSGDER